MQIQFFLYNADMDLELLQFRAKVIQSVRNFFIAKGYLETDTPALSPDLIPETCLEVFKTQYLVPWSEKRQDLYLVPSPEIYMKKLIARHKVSVFQISKCYRNVESVGRTHSPEFTMLEYYTMNADYRDSLTITENLFSSILSELKLEQVEGVSLPFERITMDEAFLKTAGFRLSDCPEPEQLAEKAAGFGLETDDSYGWDDLYEMIFVHKVEPNLAQITKKPLFLMDYPKKVPCLAQDSAGSPDCKERWELYINGIELANCYSEETDPQKVQEYFEREGGLKCKEAVVPHRVDENYWKMFNGFPRCSGVAMGVDRLVMCLAGKKSIDGVLPFKFDVMD